MKTLLSEHKEKIAEMFKQAEKIKSASQHAQILLAAFNSLAELQRKNGEFDAESR